MQIFLPIKLDLFLSLLILTGICGLIREFTPEREWYKPFQKFRHELVRLIDHLLDIFEKQPDYYFMLDGQTIILEDYFEIRPENKNRLLELIRSGKVDAGPWYILPDEWLVSGESLIRNFEYSIDLARRFNIPLMSVAYVPDMFGHSNSFPQILFDVTELRSAVLWRGVGREITAVPFIWKSNKNSIASIFSIYLPFGYGNAANLPENPEKLINAINQRIKELDQFSTIPIFLLMNGTDHTFPQFKIKQLISEIQNHTDLKIKMTSLTEFINTVSENIKKDNVQISTYIGEFRSSLRAPLLQDTYSTRMWIKQLSQNINDLLIHYAEPLNTYGYLLGYKYPTGAFQTAWKWFLRNQPHDSICGCSIDQVHDEMKIRFAWANQIGENLVEEFFDHFMEKTKEKTQPSLLVFNPTNSNHLKFNQVSLITDKTVHSIQDLKGNFYEIQEILGEDELIYERTVRPLILKAFINQLTDKKIYSYYINRVELSPINNETYGIYVTCNSVDLGLFNAKKTRSELFKIIDTKIFEKFYIQVKKGTSRTIGFMAPLLPWSFNEFIISDKNTHNDSKSSIIITKNNCENIFFKIEFNKDGTFNLFNKKNKTFYKKLHQFEDWGDKGDEYTFGRIGPVITQTKIVEKKIISKGPLFVDIYQKLDMIIPQKLSDDRNKRQGKINISIASTIRIFNDIPRIDFSSSLINTAKDHRLRITFPMPFHTNYTTTSTHFGIIKRFTELENGEEEYIEKPSGIQPQKRFIRIENESNNDAITLINIGLPEIEFVDNRVLALTLIRAVGYLSRDDFQERKIHAGPFIETPGAQELSKYTFNYSLIIHSREKSIEWSSDQAENVALPSISQFLVVKPEHTNLLQPFLILNDQRIKISSLRIRDNHPLITVYNISSDEITCTGKLHPNYSLISSISVESIEKHRYHVKEGNFHISFYPHEIKLLQLI